MSSKGPSNEIWVIERGDIDSPIYDGVGFQIAKSSRVRPESSEMENEPEFHKSDHIKIGDQTYSEIDQSNSKDAIWRVEE